MEPPLIIGLTGGVASGKSSISEMFSKLGASVIDADQIGHDVLGETAIKQQVRKIWGEEIFTAGEIDRNSLAKIVFDPIKGHDQLKRLENITHPRIRERIGQRIEASKAAREIALVLDIPLLFEAGWDRSCHKIVFVETDDSTRLARATKRGWTETHWRRREAKQLDVTQKRERSSDWVNNSSDWETAFEQVKSLWISWGLPQPD